MKMLDKQKGIFFRLTEKGKEINIVHEELHKQDEGKWLSLLERYTKEELNCIGK